MWSELKIHWPVSVLGSAGWRENDECGAVDCGRNRSLRPRFNCRVLGEKIIASESLMTDDEVLVIGL